MTIGVDEYKCAQCNGVFKLVRDENWSEEKAREECLQTFKRPSTDSDMVVVCDDCYKEILKVNN